MEEELEKWEKTKTGTHLQKLKKNMSVVDLEHKIQQEKDKLTELKETDPKTAKK